MIFDKLIIKNTFKYMDIIPTKKWSQGRDLNPPKADLQSAASPD